MPQAYLNAKNTGVYYSLPKDYVHPDGYIGFWSDSMFYGHIPGAQSWQRVIVIDFKKFRFFDQSTGKYIVIIHCFTQPTHRACFNSSTKIIRLPFLWVL